MYAIAPNGQVGNYSHGLTEDLGELLAIEPTGEKSQIVEVLDGSEHTVLYAWVNGAWQADPFADTEDNSIVYVLNRWDWMGDNLIIEGRISELTVTWELARGDYASDKTRGYVKLNPDNLKADIIIHKAESEIKNGGDDLAIIGLVFHRLARELSLQIQQVAVEHMDNIYKVPKEKGGVSIGQQGQVL